MDNPRRYFLKSSAYVAFWYISAPMSSRMDLSLLIFYVAMSLTFIRPNYRFVAYSFDYKEKAQYDNTIYFLSCNSG